MVCCFHLSGIQQAMHRSTMNSICVYRARIDAKFVRDAANNMSESFDILLRLFTRFSMMVICESKMLRFWNEMK